MGRGRNKNRKQPDQKPAGILRDEQGDLLAEAVSHVFSPEPEMADEGSDVDSEDLVDDSTGAVEDTKSPENVGPEAPEEDPVVKAEEDSAGENEVEDEVEDENDPPGADEEDPAGEDFQLESEKEATAAASEIPDSPWEQKMAWAKERVRDGLRVEALGLYRELVAEEPSSVRALNNLGILLDEMGEHEEAALHLTRASEADPENLEVMGNLGTALGALGRYSEADTVLRRVLRHDPTNAEVRGNLGILFFRRGLYEQAEAELATVCRDLPDYGLAHFYRGEALSRLDRVDAAIEALERAVELMPGNTRAYYSLGILFDLKNLPEEASVMYRKSRESRDR